MDAACAKHARLPESFFQFLLPEIRTLQEEKAAMTRLDRSWPPVSS